MPALQALHACFAARALGARVKSNKYVAITKTAQDVLDLARMHGTQFEFIHVRGHTKDEGNDLADELAKIGRKSSLRHIYKHVKPPEEIAYQPIMTREINRLRSNTSHRHDDTIVSAHGSSAHFVTAVRYHVH